MNGQFIRYFSNGVRHKLDKKEFYKRAPRYFLPNQLSETPDFVFNKATLLEEEELNKNEEAFEKNFRNHPSSLNIENRLVRAKGVKTNIGFLYNIGFKETYKSPKSFNPDDYSGVSDIDLPTFQKLNDSLKSMKSAIDLDKLNSLLDSASTHKSRDTVFKIEKSDLELIKGRLVPKMATSTSESYTKLLEIDQASLIMMKESLDFGTALPGRVLAVNEGSVSVAVGSLVRQLPVSHLFPPQLRTFLGVKQDKVDLILKKLQYKLVHVVVRLKPSVDFQGVEKTPLDLQDIVGDNRIRLRLVAWSNPDSYHLLPELMQKVISEEDFKGYHQRYLAKTE